ncbi:MAG: biopolymer transporter ExbD [Phycisphaerae bacterium]|nr:biopolymer transporter ExbD [Phycisphaerae bacterium]
MQLRKIQHRNNFEVNIAPLIDVVFLLIAFFMTISQFTQAQLAELDLPLAQQGKNEPEMPESRLVVNVFPEGGMVIDGLKYSIETFDLLVKGESTIRSPDAISILIRGDRVTPWGKVSEIMKVCAKHKIYKVKVGVLKDGGRVEEL